MLFKVISDSIVLIHFLWILFLLLGALWGTQKKAIKAVHLSGLFFAILIQVFGWYCPLTHLELWFRWKHDPALRYTGSFIVHYVEKLVYLELSQSFIFVFSLFLCLFNAWLYFRKTKWFSFSHWSS